MSVRFPAGIAEFGLLYVYPFKALTRSSAVSRLRVEGDGNVSLGGGLFLRRWRDTIVQRKTGVGY